MRWVSNSSIRVENCFDAPADGETSLLTIAAGDNLPPLLPPPTLGAPRLDTGAHFNHTQCPVQDRAKVFTTALDTALRSLPPCVCSSSVHIGDQICHQPRRVRSITSPSLPARVIDLGKMDDLSGPARILYVYSSSPLDPTFADYAALSHRWGGQVPFMTTQNTLGNRVAGFQLDELPPSFQDAVLVARSLGLRYLWIDSLCIVQDDEEDWLAQSGRMGAIFANATVTIAAHSAQDSNQGFLGSFLVPDFLRISPQNAPSGGFTIPIPDLSSGALLERFSQSCTTSRAWVMQELCLAPRILHFVENRVLWECTHTPVQIGDTRPPTWAALLLQGRRRGAQRGARYDCWRKLVTEYSACQLTKAGDKLVAVAGIVQQLDSLFPTTLSYDYHCGIFNADIERSILWYSNQAPEPLHKPPYRAPTWSWANVDGRLAFAASPGWADVTSCVVFNSISGQGICTNSVEATVWKQFSQSGARPPTACSLVIDGLVIERQYVVRPREPSRVELAPQDGPRLVGVWTAAGSSSTTSQADIAWEIIDSQADIDQAGSQVKCLVVSQMSDPWESNFLGAWMLLLVEDASISGTYRRVGLGCLLDHGVLNKARREVITIV